MCCQGPSTDYGHSLLGVLMQGSHCWEALQQKLCSDHHLLGSVVDTYITVQPRLA